MRATGAAAAASALGTLEYSGSSCGFMVSAKGSYPGITGGHSRGMIAIVPNANAPRLAGSALALGPVREMFVNQASQGKDGALGYGVGSSFAQLPQQFLMPQYAKFLESSLIGSGDGLSDVLSYLKF